MYIRVKAFPNSPREVIETVSEHTYRIFIREDAERNMANTQIRIILGGIYHVDPKSIRQISGHRMQNKMFELKQTE